MTRQERLDVLLGMCPEIEEVTERLIALVNAFNENTEQAKEELETNDFQLLSNTLQGEEDFICMADALERLESI